MIPWWIYALVAALAAAATGILAKIGIEGVPSTLATALRTVVIIAFAWAIVFATGQHREIPKLSNRTLGFLALSGLATGISWLAYFQALKMAPASRVAPIDKLSLAFTVGLAAAVLHEPITWKLGVGVGLMVIGALFTIA